MGLCDCRNVTSLFCCQHTKNVCEKCMLSQHPNDFSATTAPAGYKCPVCPTRIVPDDNNGGPVAQQVRAKLKDKAWAHGPAPGNTDALSPAQASTVNTGPTTRIQASPRKLPAAREGGRHSTGAHALGHDHEAQSADESKYKPKAANEWFARMVENQKETLPMATRRRPVQSDDGAASLKRTVIIVILVLVAFITVIELMTRARPESFANDPLLDPQMNPNIHSE
ncbi:uncharacterized protein MONBRDRAFT_29472 [Monosiga brevicollis MX1]|uniref:ZFPL1-like B-box zinc-binding domain-containing protein n=1 Tax=Monosiga brevicollis TaxID=81824 RepID=A9VB70_MONBE|nr:uncharacterized protein MONBRDRAFT_29472 [Monosiga brevicollis MX1]EDQ85186.1 predicted protein [Monosiga brevicollis MX1]|eukprot:XP_001750011.1 hypothetical protein [Monosiga brevicollis MX1]